MVRSCRFVMVSMFIALMLAAVSFTSTVSAAERFPNQPVTWIVPYTPGGSFDILPRAIGPVLSKQLGVPVVVQNIPGPEGYNRFFRSFPDGHTIGMVDLVGELAGRLVRTPVYDATRFEYLGRINSGVNLFVASPKAGIRKLEDLKKAKESVRCGSFGALSTPTLECILLAERLGFPMTIVRFRGPAEVIVAIVRGDADIATLGTTLWLDHIAKGNVVPLLLWADEGDPRVAGVISLKDIGQSELSVAAVQRSVAASPGTPPERIRILATALGGAIKSDQVQKFLAKRNFETNTQIGGAFQSTIKDLTRLLAQFEPAIRKFVEAGK